MKTKLLFTFLVLFTLSVKAQLDVTQNVIIDETFGINKPTKVLAADLNGDGFNDVVSLANNGVHWFKQIDGQGKFEKPTSIQFIPIASNEFDIDVADIDGDDDIDLVFFVRDQVNSNIPVLVWMENLDGLGTFSETQSLKTLTNIERLKVDVLDVDDDGDLDITYSDYQEIGWLENLDGSSDFMEHTLLTIPSTQNFDGYYFSDFNNDNRLDIIVDFQNTLDFYVHNGDDTVTNTQNLDNNSLGRYVIAADIDGDIDNDVVTILLNGTNSEILWYDNMDGMGTFSSRITITSLPDMAMANIESVNDISLNDIDGDNLLDLIFSYQLSNKVSWYKNMGSGNFGTEQVITDSATGIISFFAIDMDNDLTLDIVTSSIWDDQVGWYKNTDGLGSFSDLNLISNRAESIGGFDKGDLDRDGDLDFVTVSRDGKLSLFVNSDGMGNFNEGQVIIGNGFNVQGYDSINDINVSISDVDNDEDLDIVVWVFEELDFVEGRIHVFSNDGNLNFTESIPIEYEGFRNYIAYKDIDGDYDLDIIGVMDFDYSNIFYHRNNGDGTFEAAESISDGYNFIRSLALEDIDKDEDLDLVIVENDGDISWFANADGLGDFQLVQTIENNGNNIRELVIEDITKDGLKDIVFIADTGIIREIAYLKNSDGTGTFNSKEVLNTSNSFIDSIILFDIDNDRDKDLLAGKSNSLGVLDFVWYENLSEINGGEVAFGPSILIAQDNLPYKLEVVDIDDNGSLDIIGSFINNNIAWYQNFSFSWNEIVGHVTFAEISVACDESNPPFENAMVVADNGINQYATFTGFNGFYQMFIEEPGDYITSLTTQFPDYFAVNPSSYSSNFDALDSTENLNFCVEQTAEIVHDLELSIIPFIDDPRPGFNTSYKIVYTNKGSLPESGSITFDYNGSMLQFQSATQSVVSLNSETITFNFVDLNPFETRFIDVTFTVFQPPTVNGGDLLDFFATADGGNDDVTPVNNSHGIKQFVVNSYDPNDIRVMEGPEIFIEDVDNYLHYVIRFQNTGSASAININVEHELDDKLNWSTMQLLSLSHEGRVEIIDGSMVNFIFDDIHLPDSTSNEPESHGHIAYKIKPKPNVEIGDIFSGVADIYFDFNPPIITNTVNTEIVEPLSIDEFNVDKIKLYPNPTKDKLKVTSNLVIDRLTIIDINGRELSSLKISSTDYDFDVSDLSKGIYFLELQSGGVKFTKKFIKN